MTELQLIDREKSGGQTEWIVGRSPYFISHKPDGDELWLSHRPYGINEMVYKFNPQWAITLESIDNVIAGIDPTAEWRKEREERVMTAATAGVTLEQIGVTITKIEASIKDWEEGRMTSPDERDHVISACEAMGVDWHLIDRDTNNDIIGKIAEEVFEDSGETITDVPDLATFILTRLYQLGVRPPEEQQFYLDAHYRGSEAGYGVIDRSDYKVVRWFEAARVKDAEKLRDLLNSGSPVVDAEAPRVILAHLNIELPKGSTADSKQVAEEISAALEVGLGSEDHAPSLDGAKYEFVLVEEI